MTLPKLFENYLKSESKISGKTLRNYRADLNHFTQWALSSLRDQGHTLQTLEEIIPYFNALLIATYKGHHLEQGTPESSINRRLSTLRNFSRFLLAHGLITQNPIDIITNVKTEVSWETTRTSLLNEFKAHLENEGVSKSTAKNYLSDIRHFLAWIPERAN